MNPDIERLCTAAGFAVRRGGTVGLSVGGPAHQLTAKPKLSPDELEATVCAILSELRKPSEKARLAVARSIGETISVTNHMVRADHAINAFIDSITEEDDEQG